MGCGDYRVSLPNNYELVRLSGYEVVITDSTQHIIIEPTIDKYAVHENYIFGHVSMPEHGETTDTIPGYFILDTVSKKKSEGLSESEWKDKLEQLELPIVQLKTPSRFD